MKRVGAHRGETGFDSRRWGPFGIDSLQEHSERVHRVNRTQVDRSGTGDSFAGFAQQIARNAEVNLISPGVPKTEAVPASEWQSRATRGLGRGIFIFRDSLIKRSEFADAVGNMSVGRDIGLLDPRQSVFDRLDEKTKFFGDRRSWEEVVLVDEDAGLVHRRQVVPALLGRVSSTPVTIEVGMATVQGLTDGDSIRIHAGGSLMRRYPITPIGEATPVQVVDIPSLRGEGEVAFLTQIVAVHKLSDPVPEIVT